MAVTLSGTYITARYGISLPEVLRAPGCGVASPQFWQGGRLNARSWSVMAHEFLNKVYIYVQYLVVLKIYDCHCLNFAPTDQKAKCFF